MVIASRTNSLLLIAACLAFATPSFAQSMPAPGMQPAPLPAAPVTASKEPSAEPKPDEPRAPAKAQLPSCAVVTVTAGAVRADGSPWDTIAIEPPDISIVETTTGTQSECNDTWTCSVTLKPVTNVLDLSLKDTDTIGSDDPMGSGTCAIGKTCSFPLAKVVVKAC